MLAPKLPRQLYKKTSRRKLNGTCPHYEKYEQHTFNKIRLQKKTYHIKKILSTKKNVKKKIMYIKIFKQQIMIKKNLERLLSEKPGTKGFVEK